MWKMISCKRPCRFSLVVLLGIIILISMNLGTLRLQKHLLVFTSPRGETKDPPLSWKPLLAFLSLRGNPKDPPLPVCNCSMKGWPGGRKTADQLLLSLSWLNNITTYQELQRRHPNLPLELLYQEKNKRCSLLPTLFSIEWRNRHWQQATLSHRCRFSLYSAFFDPEKDGNASIRILGVSKSKSPPLAWCHLWSNSTNPPQPVKISKIEYMDYNKRRRVRHVPFLIRCPLPPNARDIPVGVSLLQKPCGQALNLLKVVSGREQKASTNMTEKYPDNTTVEVKGLVPAVCGPALFYYHQDFSFRIVEWLELLRAQGFGQVFLYVTDVHPNITKVLDHYTKEGFVQVTDYIYPPPYLNEPSLRRLWTLVERIKMFGQENVYFTDCVLRHMHQYRFLAHFDPDELPILPKHDNITHLLTDLDKKRNVSFPAGYRLRMHYFYDNLEPSKLAVDLSSSYLWILRHTKRQTRLPKRVSGGHFKPVFDTNAVRGVFSHGSLLCLSGSCNFHKMQKVPPEMAYYGHFKNTCNKTCKGATHDLTLLKYKKLVGPRVLRVLKTLQLW